MKLISCHCVSQRMLLCFLVFSAFGFSSALFSVSRLQHVFSPSVGLCHLSTLIFPVLMESDITWHLCLTTVDPPLVFKHKNHQLTFEPQHFKGTPWGIHCYFKYQPIGGAQHTVCQAPRPVFLECSYISGMENVVALSSKITKLLSDLTMENWV